MIITINTNNIGKLIADASKGIGGGDTDLLSVVYCENCGKIDTIDNSFQCNECQEWYCNDCGTMMDGAPYCKECIKTIYK